MNLKDLPATKHIAPEFAADQLSIVHIVESDDYRARLLMANFNRCDERGRQLMLQQAAAVAKLCAKEAS